MLETESAVVAPPDPFDMPPEPLTGDAFPFYLLTDSDVGISFILYF